MSIARYIELCCACCLSFLDLRVLLDVTSVSWTRGVMSGFVRIKTSQTEFSYKYICEGDFPDRVQLQVHM
ncbi:hypothetical protein glysoja_000686 [Glycine soja]|nr:hypothetical protein glysoja_000686 [Glycine soja]